MNESVVNKTSEYFKKNRIVLPKIQELCNPNSLHNDIKQNLKSIDKQAMDPLNLFRVHWFNSRDNSNFSS